MNLLKLIRAKYVLRKQRALDKEMDYIERKIQEAKDKGRNWFFLSMYATISTETWIDIIQNYGVDEVEGGWEISF
jgi:hypothetical protein